MTVFICPAEGNKLRSDRDAVEVIGEAIAQGAHCVLIPSERLDGDFFRLRTRVAGEFISKFVTYGVRLAIIGDISRHVSESDSLRDFVAESNRGQHIWFAASREELEMRSAACRT
ncbi:MAG TPA: DUF4180 domain-containing protein [Bryobacteraceae bacterium]|nr:DUF4180 domain-containing protein [Bryobacteraceae bacterium]